jgi:hypothetical protein
MPKRDTEILKSVVPKATPEGLRSIQMANRPYPFCKMVFFLTCISSELWASRQVGALETKEDYLLGTYGRSHTDFIVHSVMHM